MTNRKVVEIVARPVAGPLYEALVRSAAEFAVMAGLIIRSDEVQLDEKGAGLIEALKPHMLRTERVQSWPGSQLFGERTSIRHLYGLTHASLDLLLNGTDEMFGWINPYLPEDLHLLREDGSTVLGTIAQENDVWLELSDDELHVLLTKAPDILRSALAH